MGSFYKHEGPLLKQAVTRGGQLTKVVLQGPSLGTLGPHPLPGLGVNTEFESLSFPDLGNDLELQGRPSPGADMVLPEVLEHPALLPDQAQDCRAGG